MTDKPIREQSALELLETHAKALEAENERLKTEAAEHNYSFDLRWKADMRAIKRWQAEAPGRELTWPDHADLCVWLLGRMSAMQKGLEGLAAAMEETPTYRQTARTIRDLLAATVVEPSPDETTWNRCGHRTTTGLDCLLTAEHEGPHRYYTETAGEQP